MWLSMKTDYLKSPVSVIGHVEKIVHSFQDRSTSSDAGTSSEKQTRKSTRNVSQGSSSIIEPDRCIFCKKTKYKAKSKTGEKTHSCLEFRSDKKVRVIEFKTIRKVMMNETSKLNVNIPESHYKNRVRKISATFKNVNFVYYQHNKVLVYPASLKMEDVVIQNYEMNCELQSMQCSASENENSVIKVAQLLHGEIKNQTPQMSWPPQESELDPAKTESYIPHLLNIFFTVLISGQHIDSDSSRTEKTLKLRNSFAQDLVYTVSNGAIKTPKSVLFPSVVKSLCNNIEILKLINKYRLKKYRLSVHCR